ncbi:MAG: BON domain-containing protein [Ktedonobacterales bacterium]
MATIPEVPERDVVVVTRGGRGGCQCGCMPWWATEELGAALPHPTQRGKGPAAQRTDDQIKSSVEAVLTDDPWLDASGVQVSVQRGVVTLTGTVATRADKRRAENLAEHVRGVRDVQNTLQIVGG